MNLILMKSGKVWHFVGRTPVQLAFVAKANPDKVISDTEAKELTWINIPSWKYQQRDWNEPKDALEAARELGIDPETIKIFGE